MRSVWNQWTVAALAAVLLAGCGGNDPAGPGLPPVASVVVSARDSVWTGTLKVGQAIDLDAVPRAADGSDVPGGQATWTSSDTTVAVVNNAGRVVARNPGMATVHATIDGRMGQITIVVVEDPPPPAAVATVQVSPLAAVLEIGQTRQYIARAFDANGNEIHNRPVTWQTSAPAIVSVSATGVVHALTHGYSDVIATIDGTSTAVGITVVPTHPQPLHAALRTVANSPLPVVHRTARVTDERGIDITRTIRITAGTITVDVENGRYVQKVTMELWEDSYYIVNNEPVFCCVQLEETRVYEDRGSVSPLYSGSGTLAFRSEVIAGHTFSGFETATGFDITQRVINTGSPILLRFAR